ncbi:hypothetical protein [Janthinobacterium sp. HLX7-2]|uniref:hypothetical protein n=1 Tax=Janthinobacterium sp. HLX7-2 TaxID=1259331 RepID=UPI003F20A24A
MNISKKAACVFLGCTGIDFAECDRGYLECGKVVAMTTDQAALTKCGAHVGFGVGSAEV